MERTAPQILVSTLTDELPRPTSAPKSFYKKVRLMRRDPTIALARWISIAPVLCAKWSIEATDKAPAGAKQFINDVMLPLRSHILETAFFGCLDFGWQAYEKVYEYRDDGLLMIKKLKPLLQDITDILIDPVNGAFTGLFQGSRGTIEEVELSVPECLLLNFEVEGTNWYGESTMSIVESAYDKWVQAEKGADRYDRKMAGAHWLIHYPYGTSRLNGVSTDNFEIAKGLIAKLEASGSVAVPRTLSDVVDDLNKDAPDAWKIELISAQGGQTGFIDRMKYLDALKVRAFGLPERALLEGQFGTKAEAETHANIGLMFQEVRHRKIVQSVNWHCVNPQLRLNYGPGFDNSVYLEPSPLTDTQLSYLREIYKLMLQSPETQLLEFSSIDLEAMKDRLGIPIQQVTEVDATSFNSDVSAPAETNVEPSSEHSGNTNESEMFVTQV